MHKSIFLFLFSLALSIAAAAQTTVEGTIRYSDGNAVSGASVALQRAEGSIAQQMTSDASNSLRCDDGIRSGLTITRLAGRNSMKLTPPKAEAY